MKAVIAAGGLGARFKHLTTFIPKEMLPVNHKPLIQLAIEETIASGIHEILIIISPQKTSIRDFLNDRYSGTIDIRYAIQEKPQGLGYAVSLTHSFIGDEAFILILPDDVFNPAVNNLNDMETLYHQSGGPVIAVGQVNDEEVDRYGIIDGEILHRGLYTIHSMIEKPDREHAPSNLAIFGRYILTPDIFQFLETTQPGINGEIQLTDALNYLASTREVFGYVFKGERCDCGTLEGWKEANLRLGVSCAEIDEYIKRIEEVAKGQNGADCG